MAPERLAEATWVEIAAHERRVLVVPVGSTEQHGPHLPLGTDTLIAEAVATSVVEDRPALLLGPTIAIGASGEHAGFAGTLSIGTEALATMLTELVRSARESFAGVVLVSGHGGNRAALARVMSTATVEGDAVVVYEPVLPAADAHAGHTETSILLALDAALVRHDEIVTGTTTALNEMAEDLRRSGVRAVSATGVLGDPTTAEASIGASLLATMVEQALSLIEARFGR